MLLFGPDGLFDLVWFRNSERVTVTVTVTVTASTVNDINL